MEYGSLQYILVLMIMTFYLITTYLMYLMKKKVRERVRMCAREKGDNKHLMKKNFLMRTKAIIIIS